MSGVQAVSAFVHSARCAYGVFLATRTRLPYLLSCVVRNTSFLIRRQTKTSGTLLRAEKTKRNHTKYACIACIQNAFGPYAYKPFLMTRGHHV